jgi:hypothetical protein
MLTELEALSKRIERFEETIEIHSATVSVLVLPRGGRILGVDLGNGNLLWVNPNIEEVLEKGDWNTGGIRTWVSPERAFFFEDPERFEGWRCPLGIDPAEYRVLSKQARAVELEGKITAKDLMSGETLNGKIMKHLELKAVNREGRSLSARMIIRDVLTVHNFKSPFALWTLLEVDPGDHSQGTVIIPVIANSKPIHYFNRIPKSNLRLLKNRIEFTIDGKKAAKLGVRPEDLPNPVEARLEYRFVKNGKSVLITVSSRTGATRQDECVDPPKTNPNGPKGVIQSYNSDLKTSGLSYGELEIHGARARIQPNGSAVAEDEIIVDFKANTEYAGAYP